MNLPKKVKIGSIDYTIEEVKVVDRDKLVWGQIDYRNSTIKIDKLLDDEQKDITFWHEVLHAMFSQISAKQNEKLIDRLAHLLHGFTKDNKEVFSEY